MATPTPNLTPSAASAPIDSSSGFFTSAWYRFFTSLIGPAAASSPVTPTGSPFTFTASQRGFLQVRGGTISVAQLIRGRETLAVTLPAQFIPVSQSDAVVLTYSAAPTLVFLPS